jgi:hypothetical protein
VVATAAALRASWAASVASAVFQSPTYVMPPMDSITRMPWLVK